MPVNLKGRSLLSLQHHTAEEIHALIHLAAQFKEAKRNGTEEQVLRGKSVALIFEKTSTRTRCAFEVAAADQGATTTYLDSSVTQIGHKESIADTARVLGRMFDAIQYRGSAQSTVEQLAHHAGVPVYNGLSDQWHPTQMLADVLTMVEHSAKPLREVAFAYLGDARMNTGNSLLLMGAKLGMNVRIAAPTTPMLQPDRDLIEQCRLIAEGSGARITITTDPYEAVDGVDFVHTDVWVSMGEPMETWAERIGALLPYQVNAQLMVATGNPQTRFMHCLPAFHNTDTAVGRALVAKHPNLAGGVEVTDEVFESPQSIVFDQAENRLHTIKALLIASLR